MSSVIFATNIQPIRATRAATSCEVLDALSIKIQKTEKVIRNSSGFFGWFTRYFANRKLVSLKAEYIYVLNHQITAAGRTVARRTHEIVFGTPDSVDQTLKSFVRPDSPKSEMVIDVYERFLAIPNQKKTFHDFRQLVDKHGIEIMDVYDQCPDVDFDKYVAFLNIHGINLIKELLKNPKAKEIFAGDLLGFNKDELQDELANLSASVKEAENHYLLSVRNHVLPVMLGGVSKADQALLKDKKDRIELIEVILKEIASLRKPAAVPMTRDAFRDSCLIDTLDKSDRGDQHRFAAFFADKLLGFEAGRTLATVELTDKTAVQLRDLTKHVPIGPGTDLAQPIITQSEINAHSDAPVEILEFTVKRDNPEALQIDRVETEMGGVSSYVGGKLTMAATFVVKVVKIPALNKVIYFFENETLSMSKPVGPITAKVNVGAYEVCASTPDHHAGSPLNQYNYPGGWGSKIPVDIWREKVDGNGVKHSGMDIALGTYKHAAPVV